MLITFRCKAYANITMFGDVGLQMLKLMGHSETVPGAILANDVPQALEQLKAAVEVEKRKAANAEPENDSDEDAEQTISVNHRALPLIELLSAAVKEKCDVMWEST